MSAVVPALQPFAVTVIGMDADRPPAADRALLAFDLLAMFRVLLQDQALALGDGLAQGGKVLCLPRRAHLPIRPLTRGLLRHGRLELRRCGGAEPNGRLVFKTLRFVQVPLVARMIW